MFRIEDGIFDDDFEDEFLKDAFDSSSSKNQCPSNLGKLPSDFSKKSAFPIKDLKKDKYSCNTSQTNDNSYISILEPEEAFCDDIEGDEFLLSSVVLPIEKDKPEISYDANLPSDKLLSENGMQRKLDSVQRESSSRSLLPIESFLNDSSNESFEDKSKNSENKPNSLLKNRKRRFPGPAGVLPERGISIPLSNIDKTNVPLKNASTPKPKNFESLLCTQPSYEDFKCPAWLQMQKDFKLLEDDNSFLTKFNIVSAINMKKARQLPGGKVPFLCVMFKNSQDKVFDETGSINVSFGSGFEKFQGLFTQGTVVVLRKVSIFYEASGPYLMILRTNVLSLYKFSEDDDKVEKVINDPTDLYDSSNLVAEIQKEMEEAKPEEEDNTSYIPPNKSLFPKHLASNRVNYLKSPKPNLYSSNYNSPNIPKHPFINVPKGSDISGYQARNNIKINKQSFSYSSGNYKPILSNPQNVVNNSYTTAVQHNGVQNQSLPARSVNTTSVSTGRNYTFHSVTSKSLLPVNANIGSGEQAVNEAMWLDDDIDDIFNAIENL